MDAGHIGTTIVIALLLMVLGVVIASPLVMHATSAAIENPLVVLQPQELDSFKLSIGFLLALCAPAAMTMFWAYSRKRSHQLGVVGFLICLCAAMVSEAVGIGLGLFSMQHHLEVWEGVIESSSRISIGSFDYFQWGVATLLAVCGTSSIVLFLLSSNRREESAENAQA